MVLCNAILIALCFLAAREEFSETIPLWQPRAGLLFFTFMPTTIAVAQGQDSLLLLLILCLTWKLLGRSQNFAAGLVLANLLLKPHLALLMALFACCSLWLALRCRIRCGRGRRCGDLPAVLASWRLASLAWRAFEA